MMTSEDFIEDLRKSGVMLIKNDGTQTEIPSDFLNKATEFCKSMGCSSFQPVLLYTYNIAITRRSTYGHFERYGGTHTLGL